jgi:hypothetical protein
MRFWETADEPHFKSIWQQLLEHSWDQFDHRDHDPLAPQARLVIDALEDPADYYWDRFVTVLCKAIESKTPALLADAMEFLLATRPYPRLMIAQSVSEGERQEPLKAQSQYTPPMRQLGAALFDPMNNQVRVRRRGRKPFSHNSQIRAIIALFGFQWRDYLDEICNRLIEENVPLPEAFSKYHDWVDFLVSGKKAFSGMLAYREP